MTIFFLLPCWLKLKLQLVFLMDERSGIDFEHFFLEIHESLKGLHISIIHASIDFFFELGASPRLCAPTQREWERDTPSLTSSPNGSGFWADSPATTGAENAGLLAPNP